MIEESHFVQSELIRRFSQLLHIGTIMEIDERRARVKVLSGGLTSHWLPWLTQRAGGTRTWSVPDIGEQVLVLSLNGDLAHGIVVGALYQDLYPAPQHKKEVDAIVFVDGTEIYYDSSEHRLTLNSVGPINLQGTELTLKADQLKLTGTNIAIEAQELAITAQSLKITCPTVICQGNVTVAGKLVHG